MRSLRGESVVLDGHSAEPLLADPQHQAVGDFDGGVVAVESLLVLAEIGSALGDRPPGFTGRVAEVGEFQQLGGRQVAVLEIGGGNDLVDWYWLPHASAADSLEIG